MRKIRLIEFVSLDGVIQGPGGPTEDTEGGFQYGGWTAPFSDPAVGEAIDAAHGPEYDLLLGRKTYDIWAGYWPHHDGYIADAINRATKYVATHRPKSLAWGPVEDLGTDVVAGMKRLKPTEGPLVITWGSSTLSPLLIAHGLADEIVLLVYPVLLGRGKRLFSESVDPKELTLTQSKTASDGVQINTYTIAGPLRTGSYD